MKTEQEIAEQIAVDADMYCEEFGWQRIDLEIACYEMARQIQRWIPVEEELPCVGNKKEFFLIKGFYEIKENHILAFTQLSSLMSITEDGTTIWSGINDDEPELFFNCVVTHWRPIEYK